MTPNGFFPDLKHCEISVMGELIEFDIRMKDVQI